ALMSLRQPSVGIVLVSILLGCGGGGTPTAPAAPSAPPPTTLFVLGTPTLVAPEEGASVHQNNPDIGCPFDSTYGYGHSMDFEWTPVPSSGGVAYYQLFVMQADAQIPAIDRQVTGTRYTDRRCNSYVAPQFLEGWQWRVRAFDTSGTAGPWSEIHTFK